MKKVTLTELSNNIERLLDEVLETGIPLEINKNGKFLKIVPIEKKINLKT
ncbi:type II toxin-antitoxin system Phd/YefM family antitoxin [Nostoc sp. 'Peltigera malacea cyanobiont' DB3992]|nr:type II toxin-antitoxin system Phd/YefM family antitoxin [Nostoc sp. 'Peltigera malacea cyanobiont' DB3992]